MPCVWEGNCRSGVALAMRHILQWFIHLRAPGLGKGDKHLAYTPHGVWFTLLLYTKADSTTYTSQKAQLQTNQPTKITRSCASLYTLRSASTIRLLGKHAMSRCRAIGVQLCSLSEHWCCTINTTISFIQYSVARCQQRSVPQHGGDEIARLHIVGLLLQRCTHTSILAYIQISIVVVQSFILVIPSFLLETEHDVFWPRWRGFVNRTIILL